MMTRLSRCSGKRGLATEDEEGGRRLNFSPFQNDAVKEEKGVIHDRYKSRGNGDSPSLAG